MRFGIWPSLVLIHGTGRILSEMRVETEETVFTMETDSVFFATYELRLKKQFHIWTVLYGVRDEADEMVSGAFKSAKNDYFSILCLTTDPIHQGHEKRKKSVTSARSPRNTSAQLRDR